MAAKGWLIITRDRRIQEKLAEINAVRTYGAKMVNFASEDAGSTWGQLEVFMSRWREIEALIDEPGPFYVHRQPNGQTSSDPPYAIGVRW